MKLRNANHTDPKTGQWHIKAGPFVLSAVIGVAPGGAGSINGDDVFAFNHYWGNFNDGVTNGGLDRKFTVFAQGEVCGATFGSAPDGVIDMVDFQYWHQVFNQDVNNPQNPIVFDYGEADGL